MGEHLKDRNGDPLMVDSFVRIERPGLTPGRVIEWRGLVTGFTQDAKGTLVSVSEWRAGSLTGRSLMARPEHCATVKAPTALREEQARRARILVRAREKA